MAIDIFRKEEYDALSTELSEILDTMEIPPLRKDDFRWLRRNLRFRNSFNEKIDRAEEILNILLRNEEP